MVFAPRHLRRSFSVVVVLLVGSVLASVVAVVGIADAATRTVTTNADAGAGSLRSAIQAAAADDTIDFAPNLSGGQTIALTSGELAITQGLTIQNTSGQVVTISGNHASRVFHVTAGT